jgi:hypothetical protein
VQDVGNKVGIKVKQRVKKLSFGLCSRGKASASEMERHISQSLLHHIDLILIASALSSFGTSHLCLVPSASIILATPLEYDLRKIQAEESLPQDLPTESKTKGQTS